MKKGRFWVCMILFLIVIPISISTEWYDWLYGGELSGTHGNPVVNWYDISQWEVDVCFKWGGGNNPYQSSENSIGSSHFFHNLIVTLQAEVSDPLSEEGLTAGNKVYEVAWFIQPTDLDEDVDYEVILLDEDRNVETIESGNANFVNGYRGYYVVESEMVYTNASIHYYNEGRNEELSVPFVG